MRFGYFRAAAGGRTVGGRRLATPPPKQDTTQSSERDERSCLLADHGIDFAAAEERPFPQEHADADEPITQGFMRREYGP